MVMNLVQKINESSRDVFDRLLVHNSARFPIVERNGWTYLNTNQIPWFATEAQLKF
jgi:hypothetical protein